jgi:hypothetical protein
VPQIHPEYVMGRSKGAPGVLIDRGGGAHISQRPSVCQANGQVNALHRSPMSSQLAGRNASN